MPGGERPLLSRSASLARYLTDFESCWAILVIARMPHSIAATTPLSARDTDVGSIALPALPVKMYKPKPPKDLFVFSRGKDKGPSISARPSHVYGYRLLCLARPACLPFPTLSGKLFPGVFRSRQLYLNEFPPS